MVGCQEIGIAKGALAVEPASLPVAPLPPLATRLTVIVVTSPVHCHPSTELLDKVVESLGLLPQLDQCRLIVVADGGREATKYQPKAGKVPAATLAGYEQYLQALERRVAAAAAGVWSRAEVVRLAERVGFGHAVKRGLELSDTEYCLVVQHDHAFAQPAAALALPRVLQWMDAHAANYLSLPISTTFRHLNRCFSEYRVDVRGRAVPVAGALPGGGTAAAATATAIPVMFWYDSTHLARREAYLRLVFAGPKPLPVGRFIEDVFGHRVMARLRDDFDRWAAVYRCWCLAVAPPGRPDVPLIYHLDGRKYFTDRQRAAMGYSGNPNPVRGQRDAASAEGDAAAPFGE